MSARPLLPSRGDWLSIDPLDPVTANVRFDAFNNEPDPRVRAPQPGRRLYDISLESAPPACARSARHALSVVRSTISILSPNLVHRTDHRGDVVIDHAPPGQRRRAGRGRRVI
jgi:hypothetical protein